LKFEKIISKAYFTKGLMSIEEKIQQSISLAPLTTFKIGGLAEFFVEVKTKKDLVEAMAWAKEDKKLFVILAGGSNVLINDQGVKGLVIKMRNDNLTIKGERLDCGSGAELSSAVRVAAAEDLASLEWAIGIPGTIGGAVRGNAGAYGHSVSELVETVEIYNIKKKRFELLSNQDCRFLYKSSIFKENDNLIIWQIILKLRKGGKKEIKELLDKYLKRREQRQPKLPSAGCIFKNITISQIRENNHDLADRAYNEKVVKGGNVSAGWLVDLLGLKGKTMGGAKISLEHANFIVNTGKATAEEVIMMISFIKQQVRDKFGLQLHEEIQYLGFD
jgi:UDP-N-acetylmuramate dehydrogenase